MVHYALNMYYHGGYANSSVHACTYQLDLLEIIAVASLFSKCSCQTTAKDCKNGPNITVTVLNRQVQNISLTSRETSIQQHYPELGAH